MLRVDVLHQQQSGFSHQMQWHSVNERLQCRDSESNYGPQNYIAAAYCSGFVQHAGPSDLCTGGAGRILEGGLHSFMWQLVCVALASVVALQAVV